MPGPVADRLELMRAARANVEPILLMYDGGDASAQIVDRSGRGRGAPPGGHRRPTA